MVTIIGVDFLAIIQVNLSTWIGYLGSAGVEGGGGGRGVLEELRHHNPRLG